MNKLSQYLVEQMLLEDENPIKKVVVIYGGRFQPFHKGHYGTYQHLVKKFGKNNVFISTSNKVERPKSPFNFKEKVKIMTTMFNIPKSKIVQVRNNYAPKEILDKYDKETTAFVTVVGEKDSGRLGGKYFRPWKGKAEIGYEEGGYVYASPQQGRGISGTETRNGLSVGSDEQKQNFFKNRAYDKFNATIFKMITDKLNEGIEIPKEVIEDWLINESSKIATGQVDDGPNFFFPNHDVFSKISAKRAAKIGYDIVNMISSKDIEDYYDHPIYPNGPVKSVTYFPAGILGTTTANNQVDIYSSGAYSQWFKHITRNASLVGYELVKSVAGKEDIKQDKQQSGKEASADKKSQEEYENSLNEAIVLPVEVGDTILTGRFKNKKVTVKSIGKDEHGMPTINGKKVVTFRLMKEGFVAEIAGTAVKCEKCNHSWDIEEDDDEKYLCHSCGWDSQQQEYDYDAFDSWQEKMGLNEDIDERSKGKLRPADLLRRKAAMAGKKAQIARRRKRTMMRRKPLSKLKKIAYKKAYLQVYDEFRQELFPGIAKKDLSIQQAKIVHKNVLRKKKRVLKRARFRFLPALRDKEAEKFGGKNNTNELMIGYAGPEDMKRFAKRNKEYRKDSKSSKEYQYEPIKEQSDKKTQCINNFIEYACKRLKLDGNPKISLMSGTEYADTHKSLGGFNPQTKEIYVATENRLTADICRTIAHELVHRKQDEMGLLKDPIKDGADGSPIENQAHAVAGIIMREYGRINDTIYQEGINDFFYIDFKKYVYKNRKQINQKLKGLSYRKKSEFLELLWKKVIGKGFGKDADGRDIQYNLKQDKLIKEGLKELGITDFKSLFKKMPSDLQKRVYNLKNFGQRADKHPEGNVLKHTITVVNRSIKDDDIDIAIAAMLHDIGKDETAGIHPKKGHITHFGHEKVSATLVNKYRKWIESVGGNVDTVHYIVKNHMRYKQLSDMRPKKQSDLKSHPNFDKLSKFSKHDRGGLGEGMIMEGGAYGHMSHPFDTDINLTFGQLKDIVNRALEGTLEFTREKTDGQALAISWRDGRLVAARNKGHLKNKGENALDIKGVSDKFQGRGGLSDAYNYAMKDLSNAISSLNDKQRDKIFKQGACFMNLEVIYPTSVNVIPYGQALLVFHGTMEYDMDGKAIGENGEAARILAGMIKQVNKDVQDNYTIQGPPVVKLPKSTDLSKKRSKYSSQITKLQKEFNLKDTDGVANYHQSWWEQWVDKNSPSTLDNKTKMGLVKRWAFMDKKFRLDNKNITDSKTLEWAKKIDKEDQKKISKQNLMKFEKIFLGLGAEVLEFTSSALTVNPDAAVRDMKKRIDKTIKDVKKSGDPKKIEKLKLELGRLNSIGGSKKIVPNEGIVFLYKGNTFKLTGTFASVNQILGIFF
jgi:hypothetical protein